MSQENVEVVRLAYQAFAREGLDRFMEHFTDDVEYRVLAGADDLIRGPIHGRDAVRAWLQDWIDMFDGFWMELVELIDAGGGTVFTAERYGGHARLSGVETDSPNWTVRGRGRRVRDEWPRARQRSRGRKGGFPGMALP
jgi:ketosteroid isomerase-like protein